MVEKYNIDDYSFEALCLSNAGPKIRTLGYLVGLVDSEKHVCENPDTARYDILYPLFEGEKWMESPKELVSWQKGILPRGYFPQTPIMFVQRWSPIQAMLKNGFEPETLKWLGNAPHAVATGIWKVDKVAEAKNINDCRSDEELFWTIIAKAFERAKERGLLVNIIAQVGWSYEIMIDSLPRWSEKEINQSGRVLWKRTWHK